MCDARARRLPDEARASIASYLSVYKGMEEGAAKIGTGASMHPSVDRAYHELAKIWERVRKKCDFSYLTLMSVLFKALGMSLVWMRCAPASIARWQRLRYG